MKNKIVKYMPKNFMPLILKSMEQNKADGFFKKGVFTDELVWGRYSYMFSKQNKKKQTDFKAGMFLFGMVRKDVKAYLKSHKVKLPKRNRQIDYYDKEIKEELFGKVTGTDLSHAYWRIAYNKGVISAYTYEKGLPDKFKEVRLAALSTMGAPKKYLIIKNGVTNPLIEQSEYKVIPGDDSLQDVYKMIRYICYGHMNKVKKLLGYDFLCYKTDAIYYIDTKYNRKLVANYFESQELPYKQLT